MKAPTSPRSALQQLWLATRLDDAALQRVTLVGAGPVLPSSFAVGTAAQASLAAGALAAAELGRLRNGVTQQLTVDTCHAARPGRSPDGRRARAFTLDAAGPHC